jgi:lysophospholipase L1-like esterase
MKRQAIRSFRKLAQRGRFILVVAVCGGVGVYFLLTSHAATPTANIQPENGTLSTAIAVNDTTASGGKAVKFQQKTAVSMVKIWPVGDSITGGQLPEDRNGYRLDLWNLLTGAGYTIDYVGTDNYGLDPLPDWDTDGAGGTCIKAPVCNDPDPADLRYNLTQAHMASLNPDIIVMNGGANDFCCGNSQDPTTVENYMQQWLQLIWSIKPNVYIILLGLTGDYHPEYDSWQQQYAAQQAAAGKHIAYVYIEDVTTNDTVHPDLNGYQQITNRMQPLILPMMQQLTGH